MKAAVVVGARPNFMKAAPLMREFGTRDGIEAFLVHTGQHYDQNMSRIFFDDLNLPRPDIYLGIGSGTHAVQTAGVMVEFERVVKKEQPDLIIVVGDVNSTLACSLVGAKQHIPVAHVEAGLRSFDKRMPEEINRMVTDILSDFCFTTSPEAEYNLKREGVGTERIFFVGNIMIDSLKSYLEKSEESSILEDLGLSGNDYILVTLHRPSNVDDPDQFRALFEVLARLAETHPVVFPMHPRTRKVMEKAGIKDDGNSDFRIIQPVGYLDFLKGMKNARLVITDSGGIQEETTVLGVPCLTVRDNTERPITVQMGTNTLVGTRAEDLYPAAMEVLEAEVGDYDIPPLWDGRTAVRIADIIEEAFDDE
ncbi:MAG: UDP-N-acetylglucosamine 2-epimerase (non-hydrolyzing) [Candidatus Latescibacteria bacterium]|nr:UDP-N-acetylglucosamine 2-epimerase (non-hydrolyzing) [bacterium]MBD3425055.1 UDP-N-acetylglucosamine 2-epimerase (non-hydrolyzing) [Candidatus Latescibacterota bacterium]